MSTYTSSEDGVNHINVSSDGKTQLGRLLSFEYPRTFKDAASGLTFLSLYQYWIWLNSGKDNGILKYTGWNTFPSLMTPSMFGLKDLPGTRKEMVEKAKEVIGNDKVTMQLLKRNTLPLTSYHVIELGEDDTFEISFNRDWYTNAIVSLT